MTSDEQFARHLRAVADDVPSVPVDARYILQVGRRRRQARPVIGATAGALGAMVAVAGLAALQPTSSAVRPAGPGASASSSQQAAVDDSVAPEEKAELEARRAELDSRVQSLRLAEVTVSRNQGTISILHDAQNTVTVVSTDCLAANGYTPVVSAGLSPEGALSIAGSAVINRAYVACVAQPDSQDLTTVVGTKP